MKKFSKIITAILTIAVLSVSFAACGLVEDTEVVEKVKIQKETVLTIADDIEVSGGYYGWYFSNAYNAAYSEAQQAAADSAANSAADSAADSTAVEAPAEINVDIEAVKKEAQDNIVAAKMACAKAKEAGITLTSADYENINAQIEQYKTSMLSSFSQQGMNISYNDYLSALNTNADAVAQVIEDEYMASLYYATFVKDDYVTAKHILVKFGEGERTKEEALQMANDIKAQLDGGADFDTLMKEKSEDTGADGSVNSPEGYTFAQDGSMVAPFEATAFALAENAISDIVTVEGDEYGYQGFHILKKVPTSLSGIAPMLTMTEEIEAEKDNLTKDVKVEEDKKIEFFVSAFEG